VARSTQIAIETENIGTGVLGELNTQGEKLRGANSRVSFELSFKIFFYQLKIKVNKIIYFA